MNKSLHCLIVEDSEDDALLVVRQLRTGGYDVTWERVETAEAMRAALGRQRWDVVIADYKMPRFSGLAALELLKASGKGLPFIIVSGSIGEDQAVAAMKAGAQDYIMKGKLARLVPAVERELREAVEWRARKRAEAALRESEVRYRTLFNESTDGILIADIETKTFKYANPALCRMLGYTEEELRTMGVPDIHPKDAVQSVVAEFEAQYRGDKTLATDIPCLKKDGSVVLVDINAGKITIDDRPCNVGFFRDITARKRAEVALQENEQKYRELVEHANSIILRWTRDGKITFLNEFGQKFFGYPAAEILGRHVVGTIVPASESTSRDLRPLMDEIGAHPEAFAQSINENMRRNGERVWVAWTNKLVRDEQGKAMEILSIGSDITERKQAEERNREQAALLDNANDAIYVVSLDHTILYWNRGAERIYGWTSEEVLNRKTTELIFHDHAVLEALNPVLFKQGSWSGERRQIAKSGEMVEVFSRLTLVRNEQGQPQAVFVIDTDITEKKLLEAQFLRAQRLESIGALASGIAHDLNNVLAPIIMGAPLLRGMVKDQTALHLLKTMESSAQRGAAIVRQVLTFARGVEGERVPLQPRHLLWEMEKLAAETFPKGIRVESDVAADLWPVLGDATQLHQALLNLCINARDAMPGGGVLTLEAANIVLSKETAEKIPGAQSGSFACLRVADTGTGIPPEIEAKIFEPFFTTKKVGQGTGLGLSTVLGIVHSHGGFVRVASKVGKGTTFELYLPATKAEQVAVKKDSATPWPRAQGEGILVVDDEAAVREVARQALVEFGYRVITSGSGTEALRIFQERRQEIQLVVTDMMMPEMDGPTLVAALRVLDPAVKIVGITGTSDTAGISGLKTLELSAMLAKPFTINKLLAVIKEALPVTAGHERAVPDGGESRPVPPG